MNGLIVAAAASHSGKTTIALGLIAAFKARGLRVAAAKCGPDYIDPRFLAAASGAPAINLDPWAMTADAIRARFLRAAAGVDIVIVEGVMGLYDGGPGGSGSTASLARILGLPVILVVGAGGMAQSAAAVAEGCARMAEDFSVAGAIVNEAASERHADLVREGFSRASVPLLGLVRRDPSVALPSRHLGLVQAEEHADLAAKIKQAGRLVEEGCHLDAILRVAGGAAETFSRGEKVAAEQPDEGVRPWQVETPCQRNNPSPVAFGDTLSPWERGDALQRLSPLGQRIAVARDVAFAFAYPHLLDDWREAGAAFSFFSPLADEAPAEGADAVFLPGGYPELYAGRIAGATRFKSGMREASDRGALIYGECGGYMVLGDTLTDAKGVTHPMLGLLPLATSFENRKLHLGYRRLKPLGDLPWRGLIAAHEFHYARIVREGEGDRLFEAAGIDGAPLGAIGLRRGCVMGSFAHAIDRLIESLVFSLEIGHLVDCMKPGLYEWQIEGVGTYIGKYKRIKRPLNEYRRNVERMLRGLPYRKNKPEGYRRIHHELMIAVRLGLPIRLTILENALPEKIDSREQELIAERGTLNGPRR